MNARKWMNKKNIIVNKGNYIIANKDKLLFKRKNRKKVRHVIFLAIIMVSTLVTLCFKLPYFNITNIEIIGNSNVSNDEIKEKLSTYLENNIFYASFKDSKQQIMKNPYVLAAKTKKVLPNKVVIEIEERVAVFYGKVNNTYYILDNKGILLEKRSDIKGKNLVNLIGFDYEKCEVGKLIVADPRQIDIANKLSNIIDNYRKINSDSKINKVDVNNVLDVKIFSGEMCIKFGTTEDLENKFNKGINIITEAKYRNSKGYVDVSFKGNPVVFIED
jgi:cell division protein FtsQ